MFFLLLAQVLSIKGYATAKLRIRSGPSTSYSIIGMIDQDGMVELVEEKKVNGFYHISYMGAEGYASADYIKIDNESGEGGEEGGEVQPSPERGQAIFETAYSKLGCPFVYGAAGPNTFDASGFVMWVHKQNGITTPRVVASLYNEGKKVAKGSAGDLIFFGNPPYTVGICDGKGSFIHAPQPGDFVKITAIKYMKDVSGYRRFW